MGSRSTLGSLLLASLGLLAAPAAPSSRAGACGCHLHGQAIAGTVRDSATSSPIPGVFLQVLDSSGARKDAAVSDAAGRFRFDVDRRRQTLHAEAAGYAGVATTFVLGPWEERTLDLRLSAEPLLRLDASSQPPPTCHLRQESSGVIASLWHSARKSLQFTDWTMTESPVALLARRYVRPRRLSARQPRHLPDSVWVDTVQGATPFNPVSLRKPHGNGTGWHSEDTLSLTLPDPRTLLSDEFVDANCFALRRGQGRVGLEFSPTRAGGDRDLQGTLWLDGDGHTVQALEFTLSVKRPFKLKGVGGGFEVERTPDGYTFVRRWTLRIPKGAVRETGGEVVRTWLYDLWSPPPPAESRRVACATSHLMQWSVRVGPERPASSGRAVPDAGPHQRLPQPRVSQPCALD